MKKIAIILFVFISCNIEICVAQRSIQQDLMSGFNTSGGKNPSIDYIQNLQASKKEWEKKLSELRTQLSIHRSSSKPYYVSDSAWVRAEESILLNIKYAQKNIEILNKQIRNAKSEEDYIQKQVRKALEEAERQKKIQDKKEESEKLKNDALQQLEYLDKMGELDPKYKSWLQSLRAGQQAIQNRNDAQRINQAGHQGGFEQMPKDRSTKIGRNNSYATEASNPDLANKVSGLRTKSEQAKQAEGNKGNPAQGVNLDELRKRIAQLKGEIEELEREKERQEKENQKNTNSKK